MKITKAYGKRSMTSAPGRKIEYIVIHYTAGVTSREGSALNTVAWFNNAAAVASSDFIVDDTAIVQYNGDIGNVYTWHLDFTWAANGYDLTSVYQTLKRGNTVLYTDAPTT